jgi:hypothetical protein
MPSPSNLRTLKAAVLLAIAWPLCGFGQEQPSFKSRAETEAWRDLQDAVKKKDVAAIKEAADTLATLKKNKPPTTKPGEKKVEKTPDLFKAAQDMGLSLSRGPDNGDEKKGASFSFTKDQQAETAAVFNADFYLKWQKKMPFEWDSSKVVVFDAPAVSIQGKLTSKDNTATDAWRFRLENNLWTSNQGENRWIDGLLATTALKDESDRDLQSNRMSGEFWVTPNKYTWYIGKYSGSPDDWVQLRWRPNVGLDVGGTVTNTNDGIKESVLWLMAKGRIDVRLGFLTKLAQFKDVTLYLEDKYVYTEADQLSHNYLTSGMDFEFSDQIGFTINYTNGKDSPKFKQEEVIKGGLTVKF